MTLNTVRNICAHHGRLWNRGFGVKPRIPRDEPWHKPYEVQAGRIFGSLTILSYLLERIAPDTGWRTRLFNLLEERDAKELQRMGFNKGWERCPLWEPYL